MKLYISNNIRHLIQKENWDQGTFASQFDINRASVTSYISKKEIKPKIETLVKIAKYFNLTLDQLVLENLNTIKLYLDPETNEFVREPGTLYKNKGMGTPNDSLISELRQHLKTKDQLIDSLQRQINMLDNDKGKAAS